MKFTDSGGAIAVDAIASDDGAVIRVRDTGRGIPPEKREAIFEPFVQIDRGFTPEGQQGIGLGLAISRELALAMGGSLSVASTLGERSVFSLVLPLAGRDGA